MKYALIDPKSKRKPDTKSTLGIILVILQQKSSCKIIHTALFRNRDQSETVINRFSKILHLFKC